MRTNLLFLLLVLWGASTCFSQSISRHVIGSAGEDTILSNTSVSWTNGELVIETFTSDVFMLLQGFHSGGDVTPDYNISLSANPAEGGTVSGGGTYEEGTEITISAAPNEGYAFDAWISSGDTISQDSSYTFTITRDTSMTAHFSSELGGLRDDWQNLSIDMYPNPAENYLIIDFEEPLKESYTLRLISTNGKQITTKEFSPRLSRSTIDLSDLKSGLYIIEIYNNKKKQTFTLIKK